MVSIWQPYQLSYIHLSFQGLFFGFGAPMVSLDHATNLGLLANNAQRSSFVFTSTMDSKFWLWDLYMYFQSMKRLKYAMFNHNERHHIWHKVWNRLMHIQIIKDILQKINSKNGGTLECNGQLSNRPLIHVHRMVVYIEWKHGSTYFKK